MQSKSPPLEAGHVLLEHQRIEGFEQVDGGLIEGFIPFWGILRAHRYPQALHEVPADIDTTFRRPKTALDTVKRIDRLSKMAILTRKISNK